MREIWTARPGHVIESLWDRAERKVRFREIIDGDFFCDLAKRAKDRGSKTTYLGEPMYHAAEVPPFIWNRSIQEKWDESDWKKWLNNPEYSRLRVWEGTV